jgi:hypothetical protein
MRGIQVPCRQVPASRVLGYLKRQRVITVDPAADAAAGRIFDARRTGSLSFGYRSDGDALRASSSTRDARSSAKPVASSSRTAATGSRAV